MNFDNLENKKQRLVVPRIINPEKVLAIDPAEQCGWALKNNLFGCWDLRPKRDESKGMRLIRLRKKLMEIHETYELHMIVFEGVSGQHSAAIQSHSKYIATIELFCIDNKIHYKSYKAGQIKKFASGKGNCNKKVMIETASEKYGYEGKNDNEADALHLLNLVKTDLF